jgi:hypothetical protein
LRTDFRAELFPGSAALMALADDIEELKTICWCGKKATVNARVMDGHVLREGPQLLIGGKETYTALCRKHCLLDQPVPDDAAPPRALSRIAGIPPVNRHRARPAARLRRRAR